MGKAAGGPWRGPQADALVALLGLVPKGGTGMSQAPRPPRGT
jgi:hypothetical protein